MSAAGASAATDVTGYGLVGHLLEICRGSGVGARLTMSAVPLLAGSRELLLKGFYPAGSKRNLDAFRSLVSLSGDVGENELRLLCDAQTSGGLLIAIDPARRGSLERQFEQDGLFYARIGEVTDRSGRIDITR